MARQVQSGASRDTVASACAWLYAGYAGVGAFAGAMSSILSDSSIPAAAIVLAIVAGALGIFAWRRSCAVIRCVDAMEAAPAVTGTPVRAIAQS